MKCHLEQNLSNLIASSSSAWCYGKTWYIADDNQPNNYLHEDGVFRFSTERLGYYKCPIKAISTFAQYHPNDELDISKAIIPQTVEEFIQVHGLESSFDIVANIALGEMSQVAPAIIAVLAQATLILLRVENSLNGSGAIFSPRNEVALLERSSSHLGNILRPKS